MVTTSGDILSSTALKQLIAIKQSQRLVDETTIRLATGLKVNSALDNPQNFFTAKSLDNRASDLLRLLDKIDLSVRTVEEAIAGTDALIKLLDQAESVVLDTKDELAAGLDFPDLSFVEEEIVDISPTPISTQIIRDAPDSYYRLNDVPSGTATEATGNPLTFDGTYQVVDDGAPLYTNGAANSAFFNGGTDRITIPDSDLINLDPTAARTVELVFSADDLSLAAGRQILYEEGATVNGFTIYVDPSATAGEGTLRITAEDDQGGNRFADININTTINENQTYHVAFVFDSATATFEGFLDGVSIGSSAVFNENFPSHSGDIGIGAMNGGAQFHDGEDGNNNGYNFLGRISDVAIYNRALESDELLSHATSLNSSTTTRYVNTRYDSILSQIDFLVEDAYYRGINLLDGEDLITDFNEDRTSKLETEGVDFTQLGLGLDRYNFNDEEDLDEILDSVREARDQVREYGRTLATDLSIIEIRREFTEETINNLESGAEDLTVADQNEEGANLLALQTRQQIQFAALGADQVSIADFLL